MNIYSSRNNHRCAFTLAEVLVTLGIIGVVSAMTVPSLMQNHQRKTYVVQLHKAYNELSQASVQYLTDNNAINLNEAGLTDINAFDDFMNNYFKIVKVGQIVLVQNTKNQMAVQLMLWQTLIEIQELMCLQTEYLLILYLIV